MVRIRCGSFDPRTEAIYYSSVSRNDNVYNDFVRFALGFAVGRGFSANVNILRWEICYHNRITPPAPSFIKVLDLLRYSREKLNF